ncbi:hypothetical protein JOF29_001167 [Kribbella aluminosa]|uniref:Uncharacterized protein n=1 Tax=Kribbella aluminosa TaxID=416017 RepID=A0ABS4UEL0_9ACTN|nr:hypothetical protein [Kribbella aluminosa]
MDALIRLYRIWGRIQREGVVAAYAHVEQAFRDRY